MHRNQVHYQFHHVGIPTNDARPDVRYSPRFKMYTSDSDCKLLRVQWHRFELNSPLHPLIRSIPHVAFKVDKLDQAITDYNLLLEPYEPIDGYRVAIIEDGGVPVELIQTDLPDQELWRRAQDKHGPIYQR